MFSDNKSAISGPDANLSNEKFNHDIIHSDNHVHTYFSTDSDTPMEEMLKTAIDKGFTSICILQTIWIITFHQKATHLNFFSM